MIAAYLRPAVRQVLTGPMQVNWAEPTRCDHPTSRFGFPGAAASARAVASLAFHPSVFRALGDFLEPPAASAQGQAGHLSAEPDGNGRTGRLRGLSRC